MDSVVQTCRLGEEFVLFSFHNDLHSSGRHLYVKYANFKSNSNPFTFGKLHQPRENIVVAAPALRNGRLFLDLIPTRFPLFVAFLETSLQAAS